MFQVMNVESHFDVPVFHILVIGHYLCRILDAISLKVLIDFSIQSIPVQEAINS